MKKILASILLLSSLTLVACTTHQTNSEPTSSSSSSTTTTQTTSSSPSTEDSSFQLSDLPESYLTAASQVGKLETVTYDFQGEAKQAVVYLPSGYDASQQYNIIYLMHGRDDNQNTYMGSPNRPTTLKNVMEHMVEDGLIEPTIFVMPTLSADVSHREQASTFYQELNQRLMPAVEGTYSTYAEGTSSEDFIASRWHRAFAGFSLGSVTTWSIFENDLAFFANFLPMSGNSWTLAQLPDQATVEQTATYLSEKVEEQGYGEQDFRIFAASGTEDVAYQGLLQQVNAMKDESTFTYTDSDFTQGNLTFYEVAGNYHDYPETYVYLYNGLQALFS